MAGIAPLKAHLVKTTYNERSQPSKTWNGGRHITGSAIYSTRGRFCTIISGLIIYKFFGGKLEENGQTDKQTHLAWVFNSLRERCLPISLTNLTSTMNQRGLS